jgi:hypothetical protein
MEEQANPATVFRHVQKLAEHWEQELGDEQGAFITDCPREWEALPDPAPPLVVGIDGGYVHAREADRRQAGSFEVIAGKSMTEADRWRCLGFVQGYDTKPKRRLFDSSRGPWMRTPWRSWPKAACARSCPNWSKLWSAR